MAQYTVDQLFGKLERADAAGDVEAAKVIADEIRRMQAEHADDIPTLPAVQAELPDPSEGGGSLQIAGFDTGIPLSQGATRGLAGFGKALVDTGRGLKQAGTDAARYFVEEGLGMEAPGLRASLASQQAEIDAARERDAPLVQTGAGLGGNVAGYATTLLGPGIAARGTMVGRALLPRTIAGNAAQGGVLGLVQPAASGETRAENVGKGAAFGAGGATLAKLVGAGARVGGRGLASLVNSARYSPSSVAAASAIRRGAGDGLASLMRPQPSSVPGVTRTLGQESLNPGVMALENTVRGPQAQVFVPREQQNNLARVMALGGIAGDESAMNAAIQARSASAATARDAAMQAGDVEITGTLGMLDEAIKGQQGRPAVQSALTQVRSLLAPEVEAAPGLVTTEPVANIQVLENVRQTIGDMLSGKYGGESAAALKGSRELIAIRDSLNEEIGRQVPEFSDYLNAYRQGSLPINRMEMGADLLQSGSGPVPDIATGAPILTPYKFARATRDLDSAAQRATGFGKAKAANILTADDLKLITAINDDLAREMAGSRVLGGGSQTSPRQEISQRAGRMALGAMPGWAGNIVGGLQKLGAQNVQEKLAYLLANPEEARRVLQALEPAQRSAVSQALSQMAAQGARTGSVALGQQ